MHSMTAQLETSEWIEGSVFVPILCDSTLFWGLFRSSVFLELLLFFFFLLISTRCFSPPYVPRGCIRQCVCYYESSNSLKGNWVRMHVHRSCLFWSGLYGVGFELHGVAVEHPIEGCSIVSAVKNTFEANENGKIQYEAYDRMRRGWCLHKMKRAAGGLRNETVLEIHYLSHCVRTKLCPSNAAVTCQNTNTIYIVQTIYVNQTLYCKSEKPLLFALL